MDPVTQVLLAWLLFAGTHIVLATRPIRGPLARRLGEPGYLILFSLVASASFALLVGWYAASRGDGPPGPALAAIPWVRWLAVGVGVLGVALMVAAFSPRGYWRSPMMVLVGTAREPYGLERITRHPFFAGLSMLMGAHALLATRLVGTVFFGGFAALAVLGSAHQARKLRERHGPDYQRFLDRTSAIPFVAIATGRQRLVAGEIPWAGLVVGAALGVGLRAIHSSILAYYGAGVVASAVLVSAAILVRGLRARNRGIG